MNALIVERDLELLETMREICQEEGFVVSTAVACEEALTDLRRGYRPSIIICDQFLPYEHGIRFRDTIEKSQEWRDIPFVLVRSITRATEVLTRNDELMKPFSLEDLIAQLRRIKPSSRIRT